MGGTNLLLNSEGEWSNLASNAAWKEWSIADAPLPSNTVYTVSLDAKTDNGTDCFYFGAAVNSSTKIRQTFVPGTDWSRFSFTFNTGEWTTLNKVIATNARAYGDNGGNTGTLTVRRAKLESGTPAVVKATATVTVFNVSDGTDGRMLYATCQTAPLTAAKVATVSSGTVTLYTGLTVAVQFMHTNTAASPTLNVNGTGAKAIFVNGAGITKSDYWVAGATNTFVYDGSCWVMSDVQSVDVDVGGTNIYLGDIADRGIASNGSSIPISSSRMADESMGMAYRHVVRSGAGANNTNISIYNSPALSVLSEPLAPGRTYTASCLVRTNCTCPNSTGAEVNGNLYSPTLPLLDKVYGPAIQGTGEWERWRMTFTVPEYAGQTGFRILPSVFTFGPGVTWETAYVDLARYKIERGTVATDWSPAPGDVQTGIDDAQGTANAGIKEQVTLFYAAASATAPSKPTANVTTSSATAYAAWNRTLPTYRAANPYLYVCTQSLTNGGTYSWSTVESGNYADWAAALGTRLTTAETKIQQNTADIALKASQTEVSSLGTRVSTAEANIDANRAAIALKVSQAQFDAMKVGGTNLVLDSEGTDSFTKPSDNAHVAWWRYLSEQGQELLANGGTVTVSFDARVSSGSRILVGPYITMYSGSTNTTMSPSGQNTMVVTGDWQRFSRTLPVSGAANRFQITASSGTGTSGAVIEVRRVKCETGNKPTDWSPSPKDMATAAELEITADSITQRVDGLDGDIATLSTTANEFSVQLQSAIADLTGDIDTNAENISTITAMVRVTSDNGRPVLGLGSSGSTLAVQLTNDQLSFLDSGQAVAYINGQRLYITTAEVTGMLRLGSFALVPQSDGSLALKLVG